MINIMRWLYELFNVDQIRIIFVSMFSSLLAYLTPTKGFLIALVIMFGFNIWCGMRADGVSIIRCKNFKWIAREIALSEGKQQYIGGGEESYGFLAATCSMYSLY